MSQDSEKPITRLLREWQDGSADALDRLVPAPVEAGTAVARREADVAASYVARAVFHPPLHGGKVGKACRRRRIGGDRNRQAQRQMHHLRRVFAAPGVPVPRRR